MPSAPPGAGRRGRRGGGGDPDEEGPKRLTGREVSGQLDKFLPSAGALAKVTDADRRHGQIRAFGNRTYEPSEVGPAVVMRNEDFGRISRIMADGTPVTLEFDIVNGIYPEGKTAYNAVAEIREAINGTKLSCSVPTLIPGTQPLAPPTMQPARRL